MIARRPLLSYFVLSYSLTWLAWLPYILSENGLGLLPIRIPAILGSSQTLGVLPGGYLGPITSALIVTAIAEGRPGLRRWAARLVRWRVNWRWYLGILVLVPAIGVLATLPIPGALDDMRSPGRAVLLAYLPLLVLQFLTTGVAEEPGWRDFAQPRLQSRFGSLPGSLILGPLWGAWHLPLFLTEWAGWPDVDWWLAAEFIVAAVPLSIVMTWVFNRTGESLPLVMLFHANVNTLFSLAWTAIFPALDAFSDSLHALLIGATAAAVVLLLATRGRLGAQGAEPPARGGSEAAPESKPPFNAFRSCVFIISPADRIGRTGPGRERT
ncbi:CPBP family intramembrane glutamic endopeptidase [Dactylosporangium sp. NPDC051541]|uniref:CPBP family intramembrane glutamic endopeptidase n=1 Tax=Dactylosporangium sp. NPDC051541 TaxID=3363977 RepID=UPI0037BB34C4